MRKILLLIIMAFLCLQAEAKTIHWITFVDTTDGNVGQIDINTRQLLYTRWINVVNAALAPKGYKSHVMDFYDVKTTPENCKSAVQNLICEPEDVVVFYYIGHGARSNQDRTPFPQMQLAQSNERKFVPLTWVHNELKSKRARFTLTIGMCCNVYADVLSAKDNIAFGLNSGNASFSANQVANIQQMFLGNKGDIIITSSKPGQSSWACRKPGVGATDFFTYNLFTSFDELTRQQKSPSWESFLTIITNRVNNQSSAEGHTQTPVFENNTYEASVSQDQAPVRVKQPVVEDNDDDEEGESTLEDDLTAFFDMLVNTSESPRDRIKYGENLKKILAKNLKVRIIGQDVETVVDRESGEDFIDRLVTSRLLLKVIAVYATLNDDYQIDELVVREYYRK